MHQLTLLIFCVFLISPLTRAQSNSPPDISDTVEDTFNETTEDSAAFDQFEEEDEETNKTKIQTSGPFDDIFEADSTDSIEENALNKNQKPPSTVQQKKLTSKKSKRKKKKARPISAQSRKKKKLKKGEKLIKHPLSKKGLIRITKDRNYLYKTKRTKQTTTTSVLFANWDPFNLANSSNQVAYSSIYNNGFMAFVDFDWPLFHLLGKWSLKVGTGLGVSTGNGILVDENNAVRAEALEAFTLLTFPNHGSLNYRLKLWDSQPIIPYAEAGLAYYGMLEMRDDNIGPQPGRLAGSPAFQFVVGGALDLGFFGQTMMNALDAEYGINNAYLNIEFKSVSGLNSSFDISSEMVSFGFMLDY